MEKHKMYNLLNVNKRDWDKKIQTTVDRMQQSVWCKIAGSQKGKSKSELTNTKYLTSSPIKANIPKKPWKTKSAIIIMSLNIWPLVTVNVQ